MWNKILKEFQENYHDYTYRRTLLFLLLNVAMALVAIVMTILNITTSQYILMYVTAGFALLCIINIAFVRIGFINNNIVYVMFAIETAALFGYFIVSGTPDGFSILWTLLAPAFALAIFGKRNGVIYSVAIFLMVAFFLWVPFGKSLLQYDYSATLMLRFPVLYVGMFLTSWCLDVVRLGVYGNLEKTEEKSRYLYRHDALTGVYSRHAFSEHVKNIFGDERDIALSAIMLDIDNFKAINDKYGHNAGDEVLKMVAKVIVENVCDDCIYCRWGGEEFLIVMKCEHDAYYIAEKIRKTAESNLIIHDDEEIRITLSAGIAVADKLGEDMLEKFIDCADNAMYTAKASGKNQTFRSFYEAPLKTN